MPLMNGFIRFLITCMLLSASYLAWSTTNQTEQQADKFIAELYHKLQQIKQEKMVLRIQKISEAFLGRPYLLGALGEGEKAAYDQYPLYRTDAFDCLTYVETVLALAFSSNLPKFKQTMNQIRYENGQVSFIKRNHFTCLDWNHNNQKNIYIKDITASIHDQQNKPVVVFSKALIDKPSWYQHFNLSKIRIEKSSKPEKEKALKKLQEEGRNLRAQTATIAYIPFEKLFDPQNRPNSYLFKQIPNGSIVEIVRPNWNLTKEIGTHLHVSHLGFAFWKNGQLLFSQASSNYGKVVETPLIDYLQNARKSPTIKGINIQIILPREPISACTIKNKNRLREKDNLG